MNENVKEFIHRLRNNDLMGLEFNMNDYFRSTKSCGTVGCIAGSFAHLYIQTPDYLPSIHDIHTYMDINARVADQLFYPHTWIDIWTDVEATNNELLHITHNQRPDLSTIQKMKEFAEQFYIDEENKWRCIYGETTPQIAANALEDIVEKHPDYCNWEAAFNRNENLETV